MPAALPYPSSNSIPAIAGGPGPHRSSTPFSSKMQIDKFGKIEKRKIEFFVRDEIDKTKLSKDGATSLPKDGSMRAYCSGGRKPATSFRPVSTFPSLPAQH
jgi:hypothetical protein